MVVGRINVYTADSPSTVTTDVAEAEIRSRSNVAVDVDEEERATKVAAFEGSAKVRNLSGDEMVVQDREMVAATPEGTFSEKREIPQPPLPIEPHNNASFELGEDRISISASVGVAFGDVDSDIETVLRDADTAVQAAVAADRRGKSWNTSSALGLYPWNSVSLATE